MQHADTIPVIIVRGYTDWHASPQGATFLLIVIGGIVTSTDSGLAVPDWPTTFGYNMFLYPLSEMVGGILYEHSHRLMGSLVGILTVGLLVFLLAKDSRKWLKWLGLIALIGVIVQGVLGGLRVTQINRNFAIVHACLAQAFFALLCGIAWFTSRDWWQGYACHPNRRITEIETVKPDYNRSHLCAAHLWGDFTTYWQQT